MKQVIPMAIVVDDRDTFGVSIAEKNPGIARLWHVKELVHRMDELAAKKNLSPYLQKEMVKNLHDLAHKLFEVRYYDFRLDFLPLLRNWQGGRIEKQTGSLYLPQNEIHLSLFDAYFGRVEQEKAVKTYKTIKKAYPQFFTS